MCKINVQSIYWLANLIFLHIMVRISDIFIVDICKINIFFITYLYFFIFNGLKVTCYILWTYEVAICLFLKTYKYKTYFKWFMLTKEMHYDTIKIHLKVN